MFQKMIFVGNLGADPKKQYLPDGTAVTNFSVGVNRTWTNGQGVKQSETTWIRVSAWDKTAEAVEEYLVKGSLVLVEGVLQPDPQTGGPRLFTRADGSVGASFEVRASTVRFLDKRGSGEDSADDAVTDAVVSADIPF